MKKILTLLLLLSMVGTLGLFATPYYENGSQIFTISAGTNIPLVASYRNNTEIYYGFDFSTVGGYGSIDYEVFINPYLSIGGELGYQFNFSNGQTVFSQVPVLFKATYAPLQGVVDIPISLGVGLNYMSFDDNSKLNLMASLNVGVRYFFTEEWGLGINSGITFTPEFYSDDRGTSFISYVPLNIAVCYRH